MFRDLRVALLALVGLAHASAFAQVSGTPPGTAPSTTETIQVTSQRLDAARNSLSPDTGSTVYRIDSKDIQLLPLGEATPLNEVILQAPGVVQDSFGQLHVRGDHANVQYRIDGVMIPEPIAGFGQAFDSRVADRINFLTGALPAQYGYRTAGIVDIHTKGMATENGGSVGFLGGSHDHQETSADAHGSAGSFSYYAVGSLLEDDLGIENPTASRDAIHDHTRQQKGFGIASWVLDPTLRLTALTCGVSKLLRAAPTGEPAFSSCARTRGRSRLTASVCPNTCLPTGVTPRYFGSLDVDPRARRDYTVGPAHDGSSGKRRACQASSL